MRVWEGGGHCGKYLKRGIEQKKREGKQRFLERRGKLGQGLGSLKRWAGTPLQTMGCSGKTNV